MLRRSVLDIVDTSGELRSTQDDALLCLHTELVAPQLTIIRPREDAVIRPEILAVLAERRDILRGNRRAIVQIFTIGNREATEDRERNGVKR